ncbi:mucin-like protein [Physella acuta]|uniref:mucin-like protein n=1 Tax=Physella acuta TaxID=109671 RepID=UPI0027DE42F0|nr:mucin-like protein [Physella acuta]
MYIRFTSDSWAQYNGFNGNYTKSSYPQGCSNTVVAQEQTQTTFGTSFTSGNPSTVKRIFCYWSISAPPNTILSLNFVSVSTDPSSKSFVAVYQGTYASNTAFKKYYGTQTPGVIRIQGPNAYIVYQSEEDTPRTGFLAKVNYCRSFYYGSDLCNVPCACVQANSYSCDSLSGACSCRPGWTSATCAVDIDECLGKPCSLTQKCINTPGSYRCEHDCNTDLNGSFGTITTVQYPSYSLYNAVCNWVINGRANEVVTLSFGNGNFQLIESAYCGTDSFNIYNLEATTGNQIGKYCGTRIPSIIRSTTNKMILQLRTYYYGSRKGFSGMYFTHECNNFTYGTTCEKSCTCQQSNTKFCDNIKGVCVCNNGWTGDKCDEDVDECRAGKCLENQVCVNTPGSFQCSCRAGFTLNSAGKCEGNKVNCTLLNGKNCSHFCTSVNSVVKCVCPDGMTVTGKYLEQCEVSLYPYGVSYGDSSRSDNFIDKMYGEVKFGTDVPFGDNTVKSAYIHGSGAITFDEGSISLSPTHDASKLIIEAFWANMNPLKGQVYYHLYEKCEPSMFSESAQTLSPAKLTVMDRARRDVINITSWADFDVNVVLIATWEQQVSKTDQTNIQNTFQAIFVSGNRKESSSDNDYSAEETSFVIYLYPKNQMRWCNKDVLIGVSAGTFSASATVGAGWLKGPDFQERKSFSVGRKTSTVQQCQRYVCKNSRQITNPIYRQEIEQLYKCPCTLDRLGLQWGFYEQRSPNIYCFSIRLVAKRRLLMTNPRNKLCCYRWDKPADNSNWQFWAQQLAVATFVHNSPDAGHVIPGDPEWFLEGVRENIDAHQWCCKDANKAKLCERFDKIYPDMECSYDVEFVPGYLLGDPTIVTLDNVTYLMNGWGEYTLMDVPTENFTLQARTDRIQTSKGLSNGTVFTAFAAMEGNKTRFQVELSDSKKSMEILVKGLNLTDDFYRQVDYKLSLEDIDVSRDNSGNTTKVVVTFPCGVSMIVRVGVQNLELEIQVVKTLKNKTRGLLGNFNGKIDDEFTLPNGTTLSPNLTESQIFYNFATKYQVTANTSVFIYKPGKTFSDYQHPTFVPVFLDSQNTSTMTAAVALCGAGKTSCIYDYLITNDSTFALNTDNTLKQSTAKILLLANNCPNVSIVKNENYTNKRWIVQQGVANILRINATDADKDVLTYTLYESVTGVSINQSGFLFYTPSSSSPVKIGFRVKDSKNCSTPVFNIQTAICPQCRNNGRCNRDERQNIEYFGGQVQFLKCNCQPGFTGENCEFELDACLSKPCSKGKTCTDLTAAQQGNSTVGYVCGPCPRGYVDVEDLCVDVDECENNSTCQHTCENTEGSFVCGCNTGYVLNRTDSRTCLAKNCSNRCVMSNTWYCDETVSVCVCKNNIQTADCSVVVDLCASNPCPANRKCSSETNGYECRCMNGLLPVDGICTDCNRILTASSGSFMSTNYPDNYPDGESCTWTIKSNDTNSIILLNITDYQVEGCPYDYLEIYDGPSMDSDSIGQYCNDEVTGVISSSSNSLFLSFTSDESVNEKGFLATYVIESLCRIKQCSHGCKLVSASPRVEQCLCPEWTRLDSTQTICLEINACNSTVTNSSGLIVSPNYPQNYRANATCYWSIPSKLQTIITLSFSDIEMESGVSCPYDSLKIYNGTSSSFPLLGAYCGSSLPRSISSTNSLYLVFTSDASIGGRGFKIQYNYGL